MRVRLLADPALPGANALEDYLRSCDGLDVERHDVGALAAVLTAPGGAPVLVWTAHPLPGSAAEALVAAAGPGHPVLLLGETLAAQPPDSPLADAAGLVLGPVTPRHELRIRPGVGDVAAQVCARQIGDLVSTAVWPLADKVADDTAWVLTANWQLRDLPIATWRPSTGFGTLLVPPTARDLCRVVFRLLRAAAGQRDAAALRVGMLGFGAVGAEHADAIAATSGLVLSAVADRNPARLDAARGFAPDAQLLPGAEELLGADVDLVIVSTPPDAHAQWALRVLDSGRHVLVEKPFSITVAEADAVIAAATERGLLAASYQNRRFDSDYRALAGLIRGGALGEVFAYESFVGGYGHPCNYWHSDAAVSGGALYDWGSHHLDWMLDLFPQPVVSVTAREYKRRWHDVTNADHSRVTVTFADGLEATFTHSDLAAAPKPKWHVLGTEGAVVGSWQQRRVTARSAVGLLEEDRLTLAESPALLQHHHADGSVTAVAAPEPLVAPLHRELADTILSGAPATVTAAGSRRMVALLEAATRSAARDGAPEVP